MTNKPMNRGIKRLWRCVLLVLCIAVPVGKVTAGSTLYFVHNDHRGAPVALTDKDQAVVWTADYKPFGEAVVDEDPDGDGEDITLNIRLPGQYIDKETGLYYNYYRDYDPSLGRYIQADPRGINLDFSDPQRQIAIDAGVPISDDDPFGLNHTYGYANQSPLIYEDPTGENALGIAVAVAAYTGWNINNNVDNNMVCKQDCKERTKDKCDQGDTSDYWACAADCAIKIWGKTPRKSPWVKRM